MSKTRLKHIYSVAYYHSQIYATAKLLLGEYGHYESPSEFLKVINPLESAIKKIVLDQEQQDILLNYTKEIKDKFFFARTIAKSLSQINNCLLDIKAACKEINIIIDKTGNEFEDRDYTTYKAGTLLSFWYTLENEPYKLSVDSMQTLLTLLDNSGFKHAHNKAIEANSIPDDQFWLANARVIGEIHASILRQIDREIAVEQSENTYETSTNKLTGLPNLEQFDIDISEMLSYPNPFSVAFVDIDNFKTLNTKYGHHIADEIIKQLASKLVERTVHRGTVYHRSGDEFFILFRNSTDVETQPIMNRVIKEIEEFTFSSSVDTHKITISGGITSYPDIAANLEDIHEQANRAMQKSKDDGKSRVSVYQLT